MIVRTRGTRWQIINNKNIQVSDTTTERIEALKFEIHTYPVYFVLRGNFARRKKKYQVIAEGSRSELVDRQSKTIETPFNLNINYRLVRAKRTFLPAVSCVVSHYGPSNLGAGRRRFPSLGATGLLFYHNRKIS